MALLILAIALASALIILPVIVWKLKHRNSTRKGSPFYLRNLFYFGSLGFAFMFVEIPLLQRFILYLGNPAYAFTAVLFALLLFSAIGSWWSKRIPLHVSLGALVLLILAMPLLLPALYNASLGLPLVARLGITVLVLAPLGFLMGVPFPGGLQLFIRPQVKNQEDDKEITPRADIPWIWAVNGAASVVAPILAALLALTFSFSVVLLIGAICYAAALLTVWVLHPPDVLRHPNP
jgi:hypothetical protein